MTETESKLYKLQEEIGRKQVYNYLGYNEEVLYGERLLPCTLEDVLIYLGLEWCCQYLWGGLELWKSGELFINHIRRELGKPLNDQSSDTIDKLHKIVFNFKNILLGNVTTVKTK